MMNGTGAAIVRPGASTEDTGIDEGEAALYDRQIRLWGVEAQNRATVLLLTFRGLAAEVSKNLVLAGIGRLTLCDDAIVSEDDLGSDYFLRQEDIGSKRSQAVLPRVQALNPRVHVDILGQSAALDALNEYDLVCLTDVDMKSAVDINERCRKLGKKTYVASSLGLGGFIFADLLEHDYIVERVQRASAGSEAEAKVPEQRHQSFCSLENALVQGWPAPKKALKAKVARRMLPLFEVLALLQADLLDAARIDANSIFTKMQSLLTRYGVDATLASQERLEHLHRASSLDFAPTCAVLGGVLAQDVLNALGGREAPLVNFFVLDAATYAGDIYALGGISR